MTLLAIFLLSALLDVFWILLVRAAADRWALAAAFAQVAFSGLSVFLYFVVITGWSSGAVVAYLAGCGVGTYVSLRCCK